MDHVKTVTGAAAALAEAIGAARAAGYRVPFPDHALAGIAISETGRVAQAVPASAPAPQADVPLVGKASKPAPAA